MKQTIRVFGPTREDCELTTLTILSSYRNPRIVRMKYYREGNEVCIVTIFREV